ncbi:MAG: LysR family transcriptional regulator, partial [Lachnospiraceae bacterium]
MFNHYHYFIVLAEECNISRAAERLYITHQNLSRYLAKLEEEFGVTLFDRKPSLSLTHAGQLMLSALKETE